MLSCGSDDASDSSSSGGTGDTGGTGGSGGGGGNSGSGGNGVGGESGMAGAGANAGATGGQGGAGSGGAGAGGAGAAGAAGSPGSGGQGGDIVVISGGSWPDAYTAACWTDAGAGACPRAGDDYYGQDGTYRISVPSYALSQDSLTDSVTGLVWQQSPETTERTQAEAAAYCSDLSLAGYDDWRLPSRLELVSLLDVGRTPALPPDVPSRPIGAHWSSTPAATTPGSYFIVNNLYGLWSVAQSSINAATRCVRGAVLDGSLQAGADTVTDSMTGLEWQRSALDATAVTWKEALDYCESLSFASRSDWRLPSIKELSTLVDESDDTPPAIDESALGSNPAAYYWSSTPAFSSGTTGLAATLQTDLGVSPQRDMTMPAAARCVRQAE